jgi:hypothetical protein
MRRIVTTLAAIGAALFPSLAIGQMNTTEPFETVVTVQHEDNQIVVRNAAGEQRTIMLTVLTEIERQGLPGTTLRIDEINAGDRIVAQGISRSDGFTAQHIEVLDGGGVAASPPGMRPSANPANPPVGLGANPASPPGSVRPGGSSLGFDGTGGGAPF